MNKTKMAFLLIMVVLSALMVFLFYLFRDSPVGLSIIAFIFLVVFFRIYIVYLYAIKNIVNERGEAK